MNRWRLALAILVACGALIESCGGGGSVTGGRYPISLPPFTAWSTDLLDPAEGTAANPIKLAWNPRCTFPAGGGFPSCNTPFVTPTWPQSNSIATTRDFFRWRGVMNLDPSFATDCATGPANQSLALGQYPITWEPTDKHVAFGFELANEAALCQKIPYVSVSYLRGVQGDPQPQILPWGKEPQLVFFVRMDRSSDLPSHARHVYIWAHYRGKDGKRYMPHRVLWSSWAYTDDFAYSWNWPLAGSFQFAGESNGPLLHGGRIGCESAVVPTFEVQGATHWTVKLDELARCRFPELDQVKPDFLGFEIAAEGTYLRNLGITGLANRLIVTLSDVGLSANP